LSFLNLACQLCSFEQMKTIALSALVAGGMLFWAPVYAQQFKQQGPKLVGTGTIGNALQGACVALSADGNTALSGGPNDNIGTVGGVGATWVWVRSNSVWSQQAKLVGTGAIGTSDQGESCALSADGNTAVIGGIYDNSRAGAVWVFIRRNGVWTQQGPKLVGSGAVGAALQGWAVAVSADGNTFIEGAFDDNRTPPNFIQGTGSAWVFIRRDGAWTQQGPKLVGSGASGPAEQGASVALSADGNTALIGGPSDDNDKGAVWAWTRERGVWRQQGSKLVGSGATGEGGPNPVLSGQGGSVALSGDGNRALIGGPGNDNSGGAVWPWSRHGGVWTQDGPKLVGSGAEGAGANQGYAISMSADGNTAIVGGIGDANSTGAAWIWGYLNGVWTQRGRKLTGSDTMEFTRFGWSVAMARDGLTAMVGCAEFPVGGAWVFVK
jgi:hypothetical protein